MISVAELYELTYRDVASEERRGYSSDAEISRAINLAQAVLFNYYTVLGEERPLRPFSRRVRLVPATASPDLVQLPADLRFLRLLYCEGPLVVDDTASTRRVPYAIVETSQLQRLASDTILAPDFASGTAYATVAQGGYRLSPAPPAGLGVYCDYYCEPRPAALVFGYDEVSQVPYVDREKTNTLEWDARELPHLVNLLLAGLGISVRSGELIDFASAQTRTLGSNLTP